MVTLRRALAVVASHLRNNFHLAISEPHEFGVANEVVRMQVVFGMCHHHTDVGKDCSKFQVSPPVGLELQCFFEIVEQPDSKLSHML